MTATTSSVGRGHGGRVRLPLVLALIAAALVAVAAPVPAAGHVSTHAGTAADLSGTETLTVMADTSSAAYRWTKVNRDNGDTSYWTTARERAVVGKVPDDDDMFRSFFQFDLRSIAGAMVTDAQFQVVLDRSRTHMPTPTDLWHTQTIDPDRSLTWNNSGDHWLRKLATGTGNAADDQPDWSMGFASGALRQVVQNVANSAGDAIALGLRAPNEGDTNQWKEFLPATAQLVIKFNRLPRPPVRPNFSNPRPCGTQAVPTVISSRQPSFAAVGSDPDEGNVTTRLSIVRADESIQYEVDSSLTTSGAAFSWPAVPAGQLQPGVTYYYRARSDDRFDDGIHLGPASEKCYFVIDEVGPQVPALESTDYPDGEPVIPARTVGYVTVRAQDPDVVAFGYGFLQDRIGQRIPAGADGVARIPLTLHPDPQTGVLARRLYVNAVDKAGNVSELTPAWDLRALSGPAKPAVRGDVNGDGKADVQAVLNQGNGRTAVWNVVGGQGTVGWDSGEQGGFALQRTRPLQGDFDGDGRADVTLFREEAGRQLALYVLKSDGNRYELAETAAWRSTGWTLSSSRMSSGDVTGDGKSDLLVQVDAGDGTWRAMVFAGGRLDLPGEWLRTTTAGGTWVDTAPVLADTDGDGKDDLVVMRELGGCRTAVDVYRSSGTAFASSAVRLHDSGAGAYCLSRSKATVGDVTGDGKDDLVTSYDNGDDDAAIWVFSATGTRTQWWRTPGKFDASDVVLSTGDFSGDGKDDVAVVDATDGGGRDIFTLRSTGSAFEAPQLNWSGPQVGAVTGPSFDIEHRGYELVARHSRRCLQVRGGGQGDSVVIDQQTCAGTLQQRFQLEEIAGTGQYLIHPTHNDGESFDGRARCVSASGQASQEGTPVLQQPCLNTARQQLMLSSVEGAGLDTVVRLRFANSGKCMGVQGAGAGDAVPVVQQSCNPSGSQEWILRPAVHTPQLNDTYRISLVNGGNVVDVTSCANADGADMRLWKWSTSTRCQRWKFKPLGDSTYQIVDSSTGKAMDVQGCSRDNLAVVQLWTANDTACQRWRVEPAAGGTWSILQTTTGKTLDVAGCRSEQGSDLIIWTYWNGPCQRWKLDKYAPLPN
ncbi:RICIN domain-containing protein [Kribbella sp. NPDC056861]|uniref:RICIN domain-containing protein n=1 Tax=Kribbella sp. NPDC056861 TaxID=3154857 RepID=UPI003428486F